MQRSISLAFLLLVLGACDTRFPQGERIYLTYCANCHMKDGSGLGRLIPPLADADFLHLQRSAVPCVIKYGGDGGLTVNGITYMERMPSFTNLNEVEISNLINYIHTSWGNDLPLTSPADVEEALRQCHDQ